MTDIDRRERLIGLTNIDRGEREREIDRREREIDRREREGLIGVDRIDRY